MSSNIRFLVAFFMLMSSFFSFSQKAFFLEIKSEIDPRASNYIENGLKKATESKAEIVLLEINTFGGAVNDADKISSLLGKYPKPVWVFINKNAASAGALISLACDSIFMHPQATIGAATVVNGNDGQAAPDKYQSYMRGMMRANAEIHNRNKSMAEAMVDPNVDLDSSIKKNGQVLTLTTLEAQKYGFCDQVYSSIEEILRKKDLELEKYEPTFVDRMVGFFLNPGVSSVLLLLIIGGLYLEFQKPGIGFAIIISIISALLYFIPYYMVGLAQNWEICLFILGIILLGLEVFVIPGFGLAGILGIVLVFSSLFLVMINNEYLNFENVAENQLNSSLMVISFSFLLTIIFLLFIIPKLMKSKSFRKITLETQLGVDIDENTDLQKLIGQIGLVKNVLKPYGKISIGEEIFDAMSDSEYIESGVEVKIIKVQNNYLIVAKKS